jgi:hypothetical protein
MNVSNSRSYATRAQIARAVQAARANGVPVSLIETQRDGTIRVGAIPVAEKLPKTLFDELDAEGRL